jgi:hypothetical protein
MGKTLKHIIQGIVLGTSLLLSVGCNGKTANSSGIEKIIAPKQEVLLHEPLTQEEKEYLETKYGEDGGLWGLYYKLNDKDFALYGKDKTTGQEYYYDMVPYHPNNKTAKNYVIYTVLKDRNGDKVLVKLRDNLIEEKTAVIDVYEQHDFFSIEGYHDEHIVSGIYYMKKNEQSALNCDYAFMTIYYGDEIKIDTPINPAELVRFPATQDCATIYDGKIISSDSRISGDVDPDLFEKLKMIYVDN